MLPLYMYVVELSSISLRPLDSLRKEKEKLNGWAGIISDERGVLLRRGSRHSDIDKATGDPLLRIL